MSSSATPLAFVQQKISSCLQIKFFFNSSVKHWNKNLSFTNLNLSILDPFDRCLATNHQIMFLYFCVKKNKDLKRYLQPNKSFLSKKTIEENDLTIIFWEKCITPLHVNNYWWTFASRILDNLKLFPFSFRKLTLYLS